MKLQNKLILLTRSCKCIKKIFVCGLLGWGNEYSSERKNSFLIPRFIFIFINIALCSSLREFSTLRLCISCCGRSCNSTFFSFVGKEFCLLVNNLIYCIKFNFFIKIFSAAFEQFDVVRRASSLKAMEIEGECKDLHANKQKEKWIITVFPRKPFRHSNPSRNQSNARLNVSRRQRSEKRPLQATALKLTT